MEHCQIKIHSFKDQVALDSSERLLFKQGVIRKGLNNSCTGQIHGLPNAGAVKQGGGKGDGSSNRMGDLLQSHPPSPSSHS